MIREILISGFKCLLDARVSLRPITVLAGGNASGKSSLIQALLLLRQSTNDAGVISALRLSGDLYEAGTPDDILHPLAKTNESNERTLTIELTNDVPGLAEPETVAYQFRYIRDVVVYQNRIMPSIDNGGGRMVRGAISPVNQGDFIYLCAERIGPRLSYPLPSRSLAGVLGKAGEFTTYFLARALSEDRKANPGIISGLNKILACFREAGYDEDRLNVLGNDNRLITVANKALGWIIPDASFDVEEDAGLDAAKLRFFRMDSSALRRERPTHIGFGLSYVLPVIVGALALGKDGVLIVENPEAHLHPLSQSRIGIFLALVASLGVQVIVETHSDHVINGMRLGVKFKIIATEDIIFNFFARAAAEGRAAVEGVSLTQDGKLNKWPIGFMDQIANDLSYL